MTHGSGQSDTSVETLLSLLTDAILAEERDIDHIVARYDVSRADVESFVRLIGRLHTVLIGVHPSRRFVHRLKQDLLGQPQWDVIARVRYLPPRVQIAAGIALFAGFMLLSRRRLSLPDHDDVVAEALSS